MSEGHTYLGWLSAVVGLVNLVVFFLLLALGVAWEKRVLTVLVLCGLGLIAGLVARFGSAKDNLGAAGVVLAITALIVSVAY